jgi:hypothetical protein
MPIILLDPTDESAPLGRRPAPRKPSLEGTIALLDIVKPRGDVFLDRLEARITELLPGVTVKRFRKPTFTKPAPENLRAEIASQCTAVIEALAD